MATDKEFFATIAELPEAERWVVFKTIHGELEAELAMLGEDARAHPSPKAIEKGRQLAALGERILRTMLSEDERQQLTDWLIEATRIIHSVPGPERTFEEKMTLAKHFAFEMNLHCIVQRNGTVTATQRSCDAALSFLLHVAELDVSRVSASQRDRFRLAFERANVVIDDYSQLSTESSS